MISPGKLLRRSAIFPGCFIYFFIVLQAEAHILDELSQKTRLFFYPERIEISMELAPGTLIAPVILEIIDPDKDSHFSEDHKRTFAKTVARNLIVRIDGQDMILQLIEYNICSIEDMITGVGTIYLKYKVPVEDPGNRDSREHDFYYENRYEEFITLYSLHIKDNPELGLTIISEEREEVTQSSVKIRYSTGVYCAAVGQRVSSAVNSEAQFRVPGVLKLIDSLRKGNYSADMILTLLAIALFAGFLHAFTPGHGKALVAAYLVANQSSPLQAAALGLLVTLTHSVSIYIFGALSFTATYLFLPSRVIPIMMLLSGILIVILGLWMLLRRLSGYTVDHAHLIANLSVLEENNTNVLLDGSATEASEILLIASGEPPVMEALEAVGAEGITLCSLGCETHRLSKFISPERLNIPLIKRAVKTGAVDALVTGGEKREKIVRKLFDKLHKNQVVKPPEGIKEAVTMLTECIKRFPMRGKIKIPELQLSWKSLVSMGFAGGMVPCPDALAIILVALSMGQVVLGMAVVFSFSVGLSLALISLGVLIVISHRALSQSPLLNRFSAVTPYFTSLFITCLGVFMIIKTLPILQASII